MYAAVPLYVQINKVCLIIYNSTIRNQFSVCSEYDRRGSFGEVVTGVLARGGGVGGVLTGATFSGTERGPAPAFDGDLGPAGDFLGAVDGGESKGASLTALALGGVTAGTTGRLTGVLLDGLIGGPLLTGVLTGALCGVLVLTGVTRTLIGGLLLTGVLTGALCGVFELTGITGTRG